MSTKERIRTLARLGSRHRPILKSRKVREFTEHTTNLLGLGLVVFVVSLGVLAPIIAPSSPIEQDIANRLEPPSTHHVMGTDQLGRDMFSRILYGIRLSLKISAVIVACTLLIGTTVGVVAGYLGGLVDEALMRLVDLLMAFPGLLFTLIVAAALGPGLHSIVIAFTATGWTGYARMVRGEVLSVREGEFIIAAEIMGASRSRIMGRHIIPNVITPIVVLASMNMATVVLGTAGLSFLGLGAQPPKPELGVMIANSRDTLTTAWWIANFPGLTIMIIVFGFNLLGDGLRDVLDPRDIQSQRGGL